MSESVRETTNPCNSCSLPASTHELSRTVAERRALGVEGTLKALQERSRSDPGGGTHWLRAGHKKTQLGASHRTSDPLPSRSSASTAAARQARTQDCRNASCRPTRQGAPTSSRRPSTLSATLRPSTQLSRSSGPAPNRGASPPRISRNPARSNRLLAYLLASPNWTAGSRSGLVRPAPCLGRLPLCRQAIALESMASVWRTEPSRCLLVSTAFTQACLGDVPGRAA